ncbi:hypothetical protein [Halalkalicoccus subterraneus]|uniref:hypothetical protein n=1 Tax=Halalkalicoccus subterraneus TaxID=2675002 RepID=UPI0013CEBA18|nr:hypothetical protein [Halalkalicoccus subterraneus]
MAALESSASIDISYDRTPEKAILNVLQKHPDFNACDADYVGRRPGFWNVEPHEFHSHDWGQYEWGESFESDVKGYPLTISVCDRIDPVPEGKEGRKHLTIENILLNVRRAKPEGEEKGRASVRFQLTLQMRQSVWNEIESAYPGDLQWRAERISTQFIDGYSRYGADVIFGRYDQEE